MGGQARRPRGLRRERPARSARRGHELHRQGGGHAEDRARAPTSAAPSTSTSSTSTSGSSASASRTRPRTRSTTCRRGCASACSTSPTSMPRASRSPARTRRARSKGSTRPERAATSSPTSRRPGEVVNRMTTSWSIVPVPTRSWAELVYPELDAGGGVRAALGGRRAHLPPRDRRSVRRVDRALERAEGERAAPHGPPLRRAPPARPGHRPHHRALSVGALGGGRPRDDRRPAPLAEHPDGGGLQDPRPRACRRPRVGDDAARALGHDHRRDPSRVRRRARGEDRRRVRAPRRSARSPLATTEPHGSARSRSSTAKVASGRSAACSTTR